ncbi:hypothetical protein [Streptomyces sp. NPDC008001]|uniref:hypothetical protein n=1 Tax=Streptomyces sp. NPDC008001 TaxID=3364804 RepID=UPI0036EF3284
MRPLAPRLREADRTPPPGSLRCRAMDLDLDLLHLLDLPDRTGDAVAPGRAR